MYLYFVFQVRDGFELLQNLQNFHIALNSLTLRFFADPTLSDLISYAVIKEENILEVKN